jgi:uncharacterized iron-regulated protein
MIMRKYLFLFLSSLLLVNNAFGQQEVYKIFDTSSGQSIDLQQLLEKSAQADVVLFGELHNAAIAHWVQLQLLKSLSQENESLALGGEFFETDDQLNINEYFQGFLTDKNFETEAKIWNNYLVDYKPLLVFAKSKSIHFFGSNVPRKYASLVSRKGLSALNELSPEAITFLPPLPIPMDKSLPGYQDMKEMMHGSASMNIDYMIEAQALKDASMAEQIIKALQKRQKVFHINGAYHSNNKEGIVWYLNLKNPNLKIVTISTIEQDQPIVIDEKSKLLVDFILVLPTDSPKSY